MLLEKQKTELSFKLRREQVKLFGPVWALCPHGLRSFWVASFIFFGRLPTVAKLLLATAAPVPVSGPAWRHFWAFWVGLGTFSNWSGVCFCPFSQLLIYFCIFFGRLAAVAKPLLATAAPVPVSGSVWVCFWVFGVGFGLRGSPVSPVIGMTGIVYFVLSDVRCDLRIVFCVLCVFRCVLRFACCVCVCVCCVL